MCSYRACAPPWPRESKSTPASDRKRPVSDGKGASRERLAGRDSVTPAPGGCRAHRGSPRKPCATPRPGNQGILPCGCCAPKGTWTRSEWGALGSAPLVTSGGSPFPSQWRPALGSCACTHTHTPAHARLPHSSPTSPGYGQQDSGAFRFLDTDMQWVGSLHGKTRAEKAKVGGQQLP